MGGGIIMEESVTLKLRRYEALLDEARRVDTLEKENEQLKEELAIAHKQLEELQQPKDDTPIREVGMGNPKIVESTEESKKKFRAKYPDGVTLINKDDPMKSIRLCDKYVYSIKDNGVVRHVGTIEKQDSENYDTPDELLTKLIQKQGLHATYLQIEELLNRQSRD